MTQPDMRKTTVAVWRNPPRNLQKPDFLLDIYGYSPGEIRTVPTGGQIVRESLRICGEDPSELTCSLFAVW